MSMRAVKLRGDYTATGSSGSLNGNSAGGSGADSMAASPLLASAATSDPGSSLGGAGVLPISSYHCFCGSGLK